MATPHNEAKVSDIEKTVLLPGDPLRAKFIADHYLEDVVCVNTVRNMLAFTGTYQGKKVTVMGGGMGMPSVGIYSYELYNFYEVENIIRIGSTGAFQDDLHVNDLVIAMAASTDSNYMYQFQLPGTFAPTANFELLEKAVQAARERNVPVRVGNVLSSDVFYNSYEDANKKWRDMGVLAVEMEAAALYANAAKAKKKALCILTVSDHVFTGEELDAKERETGFRNMMEVALALV